MGLRPIPPYRLKKKWGKKGMGEHGGGASIPPYRIDRKRKKEGNGGVAEKGKGMVNMGASPHTPFYYNRKKMGQRGGEKTRENMRLPAGWLPTVCAGPKGSAAPLFTLKRAFFSQQFFWLENKCSFLYPIGGTQESAGTARGADGRFARGRMLSRTVRRTAPPCE